MKYIHFPSQPLFTPNYNPTEMLQMGVYGGTAFKYENPRPTYPKIPWDKVKYGLLWHENNNHYQVGADHYAYHLPQLGEYFRLHEWFMWYVDFYYNHNKERDADRDYYFISNWVHYICLLYDRLEDSLSKGEPQALQTLLEVAIDGRTKLNFNTQWMLAKFPWKVYRRPTS